MNPYEGLNLPELLNLMHPLVMPPPVSWAPQTPGWWILKGWLIGLVWVLGTGAYRKYRHNRYRREALAELERIAVRCENQPDRCAGEIAELVKRTALAAFPREQVAGLFGQDWAAFLVRTGRRKTRTAHLRQSAHSLHRKRRRTTAAATPGDLALFAEAAYVSEVDVNRLVSAARWWIENHCA